MYHDIEDFQEILETQVQDDVDMITEDYEPFDQNILILNRDFDEIESEFVEKNEISALSRSISHLSFTNNQYITSIEDE
jgi:peptide subunit release factor 1 (eRF1)